MADEAVPVMILADYIASKLSVPFAYGVNDCILFTVGWAEISSGRKYLPEVIWKNEKEAVSLVKKNGGLVAVFDNNFTRIEPNFAQDGDLTVVDGIAYLFSGPQIVSVSKSGLVFQNRMAAKEAWNHG